MTDAELIRSLLGGGPTDDLEAAVTAHGSTAALVALAVRAGDPSLLEAAGRSASTRRDRQLVVLAATHLAADHERFEALVRDHLVEHPDHVVAAWLAAVHHEQSTDQPNRRNRC